MHFAVDIPTPANTLERHAVVTRMTVYPGMTGQVWVGFPDGCFGLAHMRIYHWNGMVWPGYTHVKSIATTLPGFIGIATVNPTDIPSFAWNAYTYTFEDPFPLTAEPYEFVIKTWNLDDFYPHKLHFGIIIHPTMAVLSPLQIQQVYEDLGVSQGGF